MGDTPDDDCDYFRDWAEDQLRAEFPSHKIKVSEDRSLNQIWTDDEDSREKIQDFAARLWDKCPWDRYFRVFLKNTDSEFFDGRAESEKSAIEAAQAAYDEKYPGNVDLLEWSVVSL